MKTLQSLAELWQEFFLDSPQVNGLDQWAIVFMAPDNQQLLVSLANPITEEHQELFVTAVSQIDLQTFIEHYKARFLEQLHNRFGFYKPGVDRVLTEYPNWSSFYEAWLNDNPSLLQGNMPLLFDFPNAQEYRAMQLKDADYAGYRRLLVVLYQYRKQQFQKVFIKTIDDEQYAAIQQQITQLYQQTMPQLLQTAGA